MANAIIQNYTEAVRTTYENGNKGMSNLLLEQDPTSGRPLSVVPSGQIAVDSSGKNVNTGWNIAGSKYTIEQEISGELQDFGSELVDDYLTEAWINGVGGDSTLAVTDKVTFTCSPGLDDVSFYVQGIATEIGKKYIVTLPSAGSGSTVDGAFFAIYDGSSFIIFDLAYDVTKPFSHEFVATSTSIRIYPSRLGNTTIDGVHECMGLSVKELTTKTQQTETRVLTHDDAVLGSEEYSDTATAFAMETATALGGGDYNFTAISETALYIIFDTNKIGTSNVCKFTFNAKINSGVMVINAYNDGVGLALITPHTVTEGVNTIILPSGDTAFARLVIYPRGASPTSFDVDFTDISIKEVYQEDKLYINGVLQPETPNLPTGTLVANEVASIGYPDTVTRHHGDLVVRTDVVVP